MFLNCSQYKDPYLLVDRTGDGSNEKHSLHPEDNIYQTNEWDVAAPIVIEEYKLIFFLVAGVAEQAWKQLFRSMIQIANEHPRSPNKQFTFLSDFEPHHAHQMLSSQEYTKAMMVRDPKERLLSLYLNYVVNKDAANQTKGFSITQACCPDSKAADCPVDGDVDDEEHDGPMSFDAFVHLLYKCPHPLWRPQSRRMEPQYFSTLDVVMHLETAESDVPRFLQRSI